MGVFNGVVLTAVAARVPQIPASAGEDAAAQDKAAAAQAGAQGGADTAAAPDQGAGAQSQRVTLATFRELMDLLAAQKRDMEALQPFRDVSIVRVATAPFKVRPVPRAARPVGWRSLGPSARLHRLPARPAMPCPAWDAAPRSSTAARQRAHVRPPSCGVGPRAVRGHPLAHRHAGRDARDAARAGRRPVRRLHEHGAERAQPAAGAQQRRGGVRGEAAVPGRDPRGGEAAGRRVQRDPRPVRAAGRLRHPRARHGPRGLRHHGLHLQHAQDHHGGGARWREREGEGGRARGRESWSG